MHKHVMIAGIDADNEVSIKLHESLGFINVGHFHEVGFKFGRWLDFGILGVSPSCYKAVNNCKKPPP